MPKKSKQPVVDSDSENENEIKEFKQLKSKQNHSKESNSSKLDSMIQKIDNLHTAIMRIDSSSDSSGNNDSLEEHFNSLKEYFDTKFNELKDEINEQLNSFGIHSQNTENSDNSEDEKPSKTSKKETRSKKKPVPNTSFMTFKSEKEN